MPFILIVLAVGLVVFYYYCVPHGDSRRYSGNVVLRPSEKLGRLDGQSRFEQAYHRKTAENEAIIHQAEQQAVAAIHEQTMIDKASELGIPRDFLSVKISSEHAQQLLFERLERQADIDVQKEAKMLKVWLSAARAAKLSLYLELEDILRYFTRAVEHRAKIKQKSQMTLADIDVLRLLDRAIPSLEATYYARIGQIAISAGSGQVHRGADEDSEGAGDRSGLSEAATEPIPPPDSGVVQRRVGFSR